jgi:hypothetical protein
VTAENAAARSNLATALAGEIQFREALRIDPTYEISQENLNDIMVKGK